MARNISRAATVRRRIERKKVLFADAKDELQRRIAFLEGFVGADLLQTQRDKPDTRSLFHLQERLKLLMMLEDQLFWWDVWVRGFEAAVRRQRKRFHKKWLRDRKKEQAKFREKARSRELL